MPSYPTSPATDPRARGSLGCYTPTVQRTRTYHPSDADLSVTRIVHASAVIDFPETKILLDPWYNPTPPLGPSEPMGLSLENLPPMRGILITHKHDDHFDADTLRDYPDKSLRVIVPRGLGAQVRAMGYEDVVELDAVGPLADRQRDRHRRACSTQRSRERLRVAGQLGHALRRRRHAIRRADVPRDRRALPDDRCGTPPGRRDPHLRRAARHEPGGGRGRVRDPEAAARHSLSLRPHRSDSPSSWARRTPEKKFQDAVAKRDETARKAVVILEPGASWHHYR